MNQPVNQLPCEEPYIKLSIRQNTAWEKIAQKLGAPTQEVIDLYKASRYLGEFKGFANRVHSGKLTLAGLRTSLCRPTKTRTAEENKEFEDVIQSLDEIDLETWELRKLIRVGDELEATEDKYYLSGPQYLIKGKRYPIISLHEEGPVEFGGVTLCEMPLPEKLWFSNFGVRRLFRDGNLIWPKLTEDEFHQGRTLFAIHKDNVLSIPGTKDLTHKKWFATLGIPFETTPRGFSDASGIYAYIGENFNTNPELQNIVLDNLPEILEATNSFDFQDLRFGMIPQKNNARWPEIFNLGPIRDILPKNDTAL